MSLQHNETNQQIKEIVAERQLQFNQQLAPLALSSLTDILQKEMLVDSVPFFLENIQLSQITPECRHDLFLWMLDLSTQCCLRIETLQRAYAYMDIMLSTVKIEYEARKIIAVSSLILAAKNDENRELSDQLADYIFQILASRPRQEEPYVPKWSDIIPCERALLQFCNWRSMVPVATDFLKLLLYIANQQEDFSDLLDKASQYIFICLLSYEIVSNFRYSSIALASLLVVLEDLDFVTFAEGLIYILQQYDIQFDFSQVEACKIIIRLHQEDQSAGSQTQEQQQALDIQQEGIQYIESIDQANHQDQELIQQQGLNNIFCDNNSSENQNIIQESIENSNEIETSSLNNCMENLMVLDQQTPVKLNSYESNEMNGTLSTQCFSNTIDQYNSSLKFKETQESSTFTDEMQSSSLATQSFSSQVILPFAAYGEDSSSDSQSSEDEENEKSGSQKTKKIKKLRKLTPSSRAQSFRKKRVNSIRKKSSRGLFMNFSSSIDYNKIDSYNDIDEDMPFSDATLRNLNSNSTKHNSDQFISKSINLISCSKAQNSDMSTCWATEEDFHVQQLNKIPFLPSYSPQME
eukprot:403361823